MKYTRYTFKFRWLIALSVVALLSPAISFNLSGANTDRIQVTTPDGRVVTVDAVTDNIVKVTNLAKGEKAPVTRTSVIGDSHINATVSELNGVTTLTTPGGIVVRLSSATGEVDITAGKNRGISDNGVRTQAGGKQRIELSTMGSGSFYGAGERGYSFNLSGDTLVMYNKQNYGYTAGESRITLHMSCVLKENISYSDHVC